MKRNYLTVLLLSVTLVVVIYGVYRIWISYKTTSVVFVGDPTKTVVVASEQDTLFSEQAQLPTETPATLRMPYAKAVALYSGRTMTFDMNCRVAPFILTVPYRGVVMLDNRSDQPREIGIGTRRININPFDFFVTTINRRGDLTVSCDGLENVALVSVTE